MKRMSYTSLDQRLYADCLPRKPEQAEMVIYNKRLGDKLGIDRLYESLSELTAVFSGQMPFEDTAPIAQAYGGHQFGYFTILGDGRAHLIGEIKMPDGQIADCMLKGSGETPYSRNGDGLAALGPMLREYIISEAMDALLIPTSRSLAVVATKETVYREKPVNGAILTRIAASHIRVGTFQYAAILQDTDVLKGLADYSINRHYQSETEQADVYKESKYLTFFRAVLNRQAKLITRWLAVGFIHGVMNTDNMAISGETIDYGPCAFMNTYNPKTVFSSIDTRGRYAYDNQSYIAKWNLARLGETLLPIIDDDQNKAVEGVNRVLAEFDLVFAQAYAKEMGAKLGFGEPHEDDDQLISKLFHWMEQYQADFTDTFRDLSLGEVNKLPFYQNSDFEAWHAQVMQRQMQSHTSRFQVEKAMRSVNPAFIPRNHLVEEALLFAAEKNEMDNFHKLLKLVLNPFAYTNEQLAYRPPAEGYDENYKTYCGT